MTTNTSTKANDTNRRRNSLLSVLLGGLLVLPATAAPVFAQHRGGGGFGGGFGGGSSAHRGGGMSSFSQRAAQFQQRPIIAQPLQRPIIAQPLRGVLQQKAATARHLPGIVSTAGTLAGKMPHPGVGSLGGNVVAKPPVNAIHRQGTYHAIPPSNALIKNFVARPGQQLRSTNPIPGQHGAGAMATHHFAKLNPGLHKANADLWKTLSTSKTGFPPKGPIVSQHKSPTGPWPGGNGMNGPNHHHGSGIYAFEGLLLAFGGLGYGYGYGYGGYGYGGYGYGGPSYPPYSSVYYDSCPSNPLIVPYGPSTTDPWGAQPGTSVVFADSQVIPAGGLSATTGDAAVAAAAEAVGDASGPGDSPGATVVRLVETSHRVEGAVDPGMSSAPAESSGPRLVLVNPGDSGGPVSYLIDGRPYTIEPGGELTLTLTDRTSWLVDFDRGEAFGPTRYTLTEGTYTFTVTDQGWNLFNTKFKVTLDNSENPFDFHFVKGDRADLVQAGQTRTLDDKYVVDLSFDQGVGDAPASRSLASGVYRVGLDPATDRLDLLPAAGGKVVRPEPADRGRTRLAGDTSAAPGQ